MVIFCYYKIKKYADFHVWHPAMKLLWMQININVIFDYHTNCSKIENVRQRVVFQKKWWWSFRKWWYQYAKWNKGLNSNFFDTNWSYGKSSTSKETLSILLFVGAHTVISQKRLVWARVPQLVHIGTILKDSTEENSKNCVDVTTYNCIAYTGYSILYSLCQILWYKSMC